MIRKEINRRCARIDSLQQLRLERERIDWIIRDRKAAIGGDLEEVRELFSWDYISGVALNAFQPFISGVLGGVQGLFSFFGRSARKGGKKIRR